MLPFLINGEKILTPPLSPLPLSKKFKIPPKNPLPLPPNRVLAYFSYLFQLFINRAMHLWPVTCDVYSVPAKFNVNQIS